MSGRDIQIRIGVADSLYILIDEQGVAHSPEVLDDMMTRAVKAFREVWPDVADFEIESEDEAATPDE